MKRWAFGVAVAASLACGGGGEPLPPPEPPVIPVAPPPPAEELPPPSAPTKAVRRSSGSDLATDPPPPVAVVVEPVKGPVPSATGSPAVPASSATSGEVTLSLAPSDPAIAKIAGRFTGQLRGCYVERLAVHPGLAGDVTVRFTPSGGRPGSVAIATDTTGDPEIGRCVISRVERWSLPPDLTGEQSATFRFTPDPG